MGMEENPYAPPKESVQVVGVKSGKRADLRTVAVVQKSIIICILPNFGSFAAQYFVPPEWMTLLMGGLLILFVVQTVSVVIWRSGFSA